MHSGNGELLAFDESPGKVTNDYYSHGGNNADQLSVFHI
jgi:hypothetical protein